MLIYGKRQRKKEDAMRECKICSTKDKLVTHHLNDRTNHPDQAREKDNIVTLCNSCHIQYHTNWNSSFKEKTTKEDFKFFEYYMSKVRGLNATELAFYNRSKLKEL